MTRSFLTRSCGTCNKNNQGCNEKMLTTVRKNVQRVREVEEERDWSRCLYRITVPSPRPIARWARLEDRATVVTCTLY